MGWIYKEHSSTQIFSNYMELAEENLKKNKKKRAIIISGPTGIGKSTLAIKIAKILGGEVVSADSMQVYRNMDIGTAKMPKEEREGIVHHMIDVCDVNQPFNVAKFYKGALDSCFDIVKREKVPIVVGGTGFYIHSLIYGPPKGPPSVKNIREKLEIQLDKMGVDVMYERLQMVDPEYANSITPKDKNKIIRALEIVYITKKPVSYFKKEEKEENFFDFRCWFLSSPKERIYPIVDFRCEKMIENGFLDEVKKLKEIGIEKNKSASNAIGYRQALNFLDGKYVYEEFLEEFKKATRKYIKRQITWFKKEKLFRVLDLSKIDFERAIEFILQDYERG